MTDDNVDDGDGNAEEEGDETGECVHREGEVIMIDDNADDNAEDDGDETGECGHREGED